MLSFQDYEKVLKGRHIIAWGFNPMNGKRGFNPMNEKRWYNPMNQKRKTNEIIT